MNGTSEFRSRIRVGPMGGLFLALVVATWGSAGAQQFNGDNQWVAPHGVGTFVLTVGQEYSTIMAVAALLPETEFNLGVTHFVEKPLDPTEGHYSGIFYVKRRLSENEAGTGGWAVMGGTGVYPGYLSEGEVTDTFQSWWANAVYTIPFRDGAVTWDLLPGFLVNLDKDQTGRDGVGHDLLVAGRGLQDHSPFRDRRRGLRHHGGGLRRADVRARRALGEPER